LGQFEYVMVLISIIVGLGITNILVGLAGVVDRLAGSSAIRPRVAYFAWLANSFIWLVQFWWWEFRFDQYVTNWTVGLYWFLVLYAVTLFLLAAVLVPQSWDGVGDLGDYLLERKRWFYSILVFGNALDVVDSYLKGGFTYIAALPISSSLIWGASVIACIVGFRARTLRPHTIVAVLVLGLQIISAFALPILGQVF
jgi:hypothetical protein